jgi:hypothetical protein
LIKGVPLGVPGFAKVMVGRYSTAAWLQYRGRGDAELLRRWKLRAYGELDYKPAENWIFSVKYDYWVGSASTPASNWGVFSSFDQLVIDVGYTF